MLENRSVLTEVPSAVLEGDGPVWVEAMPARTYQTPFYGEVPITVDKLANFVNNFKSNVRGQEIPVDFEHGLDRAKGDKAAGWFKDVKVDVSSDDPKQFSLWALVDFTNEAKDEIKDKQWKYVSLDWEDEWQDNDGKKFSDVIAALGLTNRPIAKKTLPINFSEKMWKELDDEDKKLFANVVIDRLNESKEWEHSEPGTGNPPAPKTDEDGSDDPAITGGWRVPTPAPEGTPQGAVARVDGRQIAKAVKEGRKMAGTEFVLPETEARDLFHALDLDSDTKPADVVEAIKIKFSEHAALTQKQEATEQEKKFAEQYPQYWAEHNKLMARDRDNAAIKFSEGVKTIRKPEGYGLKDTKQGLSMEALNSIVAVHKKFSEGTVTVDDFEDVLKKIVNGGIVQFGELGSSGADDEVPSVDTTTAEGIAGAKKLFSEVLTRIQGENPDKDFRWALTEASKKHPDLAEASKQALPG